MPCGIQVWDAKGNLIVDIADRLARFLGSRVINGSADSLYDPALLTGENGEAFVAFQPDFIFGYVNGDTTRPIFSISGATIAWTYSAGFSTHSKAITGQLFYGVR